MNRKAFKMVKGSLTVFLFVLNSRKTRIMGKWKKIFRPHTTGVCILITGAVIFYERQWIKWKKLLCFLMSEWHFVNRVNVCVQKCGCILPYSFKSSALYIKHDLTIYTECRILQYLPKHRSDINIF